MEESMSLTITKILETEDLGCLMAIDAFKSNDQNEMTRTFLEKLLDRCGKIDINTHYFKDTPDTERYTLMQFSTLHNLKALVKALLDLNINPNFVQGGVDSSSKRKLGVTKSNPHSAVTGAPKPELKKCETPPILIAAEKGNYQLLKIFKYHNFSCLSQRNKSDEVFKDEDEGLPLKDFEILTHNVDFSIVHPVKKETVLHTVLQQRLLEQGVDQRNQGRSRKRSRQILRTPTDRQLSTLSGKDLSNEIYDIAVNYLKCANVLLDLDEFEKRTENPYDYPRHIRAIVNLQDIEGNTPLHYAVYNWPEEIVKKLLNLGANASVKNKNKEIPLSRMKKHTIRDFMNKQCIIVEDFDPSDDEIDENDSDDTDDEKAKQILEDYDQTFMMNISQCGKDGRNEMTFDFAFLAPPKFQHKLCTQKANQSENNSLLTPPDAESQKKPKDNNKLYYPSEMELLSKMCEYPETRDLITHPVIASYLWLKWKLMTKFFNRNLRLDFLFLYCVTWHIFDEYGGMRWNSASTERMRNMTHYVGRTREFCAEPEYKFEPFKFDGFGFTMFWYIIFGLHAIIQVVSILRDLRKDISMKFSANYKQSSQSPIAAGWLDCLNLTLIGLVIFGGKGILWLVISIQILFYMATEWFQMINAKCKYFQEKSNWIDLAIIGFLMIVMYVPNDRIKNPTTFSVFDDNNTNANVIEADKCRVKRCISAALIVLIWTRFLMSIAKFPGWKEYNLYVIMFYKVMQRYFKILAWYSMYLIAFGLGFYIMLHDDTELNPKNNLDKTNENMDETKSLAKNNFTKTTFDNPYLALAKTSAMFIGEIEFGDLPIHGGDINVVMAHIFLLLFIFLMIVVLMNLLNGLAVSDTGRIVEESEISSQITFIKTIQYFESVYIGHMGWVKLFNKMFPALTSFIESHLVPRGLLIFYSPYINDEMKLTFPLRQQQLLFNCLRSNERGSENDCCGDNNEYSFITLLKEKFESLFGDDENYGSEEFLENARKILIQEKLNKMKRRREELEKKRKKKRKEKRDERIKNIEDIVIRNSLHS